MRIAAVVQARMSSTRLPGKVLADIHGKPLLQYIMERLRRCDPVDRVAVATSVDPSDDPIQQFCAEVGVTCVRGPLDNVAARFLNAVDALDADAFVRISGDSPLIDQRLVEEGIELFLAKGADLASNVVERSFPAGESVEVVRSEAFRRACGRMREPHHFEHVTPVFYEHGDEFHVVGFTAPEHWQHIRLAVDTEQDLQVVTRMIGAMDRPHWAWDVPSLVRLYGEVAGSCRS